MLPIHQDSYKHSKTTVGKISKNASNGARFFRIIIFCGVMVCNLWDNGSQKSVLTSYLDAPPQDLSNGGLGSFVTISVCWQLDFSCSMLDLLYLSKLTTSSNYGI